jgi:iron-sulfur cluster assembly protein
MISLTPAAARQIHAAFEDSDAESPVLRIAAHLNTDGSLEFGLGFDELREGDLSVEDKGIELLIGRPSQELLADTVLDFVELAAGQFGFTLQPQEEEAAAPAAGAGCGSGGCSRCGGAA